MLKVFIEHLWLSPTFLLHGWGNFFEQEFHKILVLHLIAIIGSYVINISYYFSQWQVSLIIILVRKYLAGGFCYSQKNLYGKIVIVTGACSGIGRETAKNLALRGAKIIMACNILKKANVVAEELRIETGGEISVLELDLCSLMSIRSFVKEFQKDHDSLHILINNAGIMMCPYGLTTDGFEMQFGTNHFGPFLLTNLLLPMMANVPEARIIIVSSIMHLFSFLDLNDLKYDKGYNAVIAYSNSKLANILFSVSLNERLKDTNIKVFAVHPGVVQSQLGKYLSFGGDIIYNRLLSYIFKSASQGAQTTLYCALEANSQKCCYYSDCSIGSPSEIAENKVLANKLWQISENLVDLKRDDNYYKNIQSNMKYNITN